MDILSIAITIFIVLESLNVMILYFHPDFKYGNGVAVFKSWEVSKQDEVMHLFARYMANWVAGTKLIFIVLLLVILLTGTAVTKLWAVVAMILSIATYFWKLHPIIKTLDAKGEIQPAGYSKTLGFMIGSFMFMFTAALIVYLVAS